MSQLQISWSISNDTAVKLFDSLAESTWNWLGDARTYSLGFSEDTVSDLNTLEVARNPPSAIKITRLSRIHERITGFDWMWIVDNPRNQPVIYVVQAKKMRISQTQDRSYGRIKYPDRPPYQIDALRKCADRIGAIPLYCFYNNVEGVKIDPYWHCAVEAPNAPQMGCTLAPLEIAFRVQNKDIRNNFSSIHESSRAVPWRCLFHPGCTDFGHDHIARRQERGEDTFSSEARLRRHMIASRFLRGRHSDFAQLDRLEFSSRPYPIMRSKGDVVFASHGDYKIDPRELIHLFGYETNVDPEIGFPTETGFYRYHLPSRILTLQIGEDVS